MDDLSQWWPVLAVIAALYFWRSIVIFAVAIGAVVGIGYVWLHYQTTTEWRVGISIAILWAASIVIRWADDGKAAARSQAPSTSSGGWQPSPKRPCSYLLCQNGQISCSCSGLMSPPNSSCSRCFGSGSYMCQVCNGTGYV